MRLSESSIMIATSVASAFIQPFNSFIYSRVSMRVELKCHHPLMMCRSLFISRHEMWRMLWLQWAKIAFHTHHRFTSTQRPPAANLNSFVMNSNESDWFFYFWKMISILSIVYFCGFVDWLASILQSPHHRRWIMSVRWGSLSFQKFKPICRR